MVGECVVPAERQSPSSSQFLDAESFETARTWYVGVETVVIYWMRESGALDLNSWNPADVGKNGGSFMHSSRTILSQLSPERRTMIGARKYRDFLDPSE
jgi:hypothetical protein